MVLYDFHSPLVFQVPWLSRGGWGRNHSACLIDLTQEKCFLVLGPY